VFLSRVIPRLLCCCLTLALPTFGAPGFRVGDLWIVDTSVPDVLQSQTLQAPPELTASGKLQYEIGFSTREQVDLGFLFDSLTIALANADGSSAVNLFTADVFGLTIVPFSSTGLMGNGGVAGQPTSLRTSLLDNPTMSFAYAIEVTLPPSLAGTELRTTFSFFNNGDDVPTRSYATLIPEPSTLALVGVGGAFALAAVNRKRARK
jgi:hypothetical protein